MSLTDSLQSLLCDLADYPLHLLTLQLRCQHVCDFINSLLDGIHPNDETSLHLLEASMSALGVAIPFEAQTATITGHFRPVPTVRGF